jgi:hypothetical protein
MCRNIKTLFNFDPPVNDDEIRAASLQFVRKITGFNKPSKANEATFLEAVEEVAAVRSTAAFPRNYRAPQESRGRSGEGKSSRRGAVRGMNLAGFSRKLLRTGASH